MKIPVGQAKESAGNPKGNTLSPKRIPPVDPRSQGLCCHYTTDTASISFPFRVRREIHDLSHSPDCVKTQLEPFD